MPLDMFNVKQQLRAPTRSAPLGVRGSHTRRPASAPPKATTPTSSPPGGAATACTALPWFSVWEVGARLHVPQPHLKGISRNSQHTKPRKAFFNRTHLRISSLHAWSAANCYAVRSRRCCDYGSDAMRHRSLVA